MTEQPAEPRGARTPDGAASAPPPPSPAPPTPHVDAPAGPSDSAEPPREPYAPTTAADPAGAADEPTRDLGADPTREFGTTPTREFGTTPTREFGTETTGADVPPPTAGADVPPSGDAGGPPGGADIPPPGGADGLPPGGAGGWPPPGPPPGGAGFTSRYGLVRPRQGRYLAGVCAAIGRATNTDPVLWRVLLAVLGFFGGIGILIYLAAWLVIPAEGDTASPVESMLGRGRSSMSPIMVIVLGVLVAVMFGLIVTDKFRAVLLGAAIVIGGALLLNRNGGGRLGQPAGAPPLPPGGQPGAGWPGLGGPGQPAEGQAGGFGRTGGPGGWGGAPGGLDQPGGIAPAAGARPPEPATSGIGTAGPAPSLLGTGIGYGQPAAPPAPSGPVPSWLSPPAPPSAGYPATSEFPAATPLGPTLDRGYRPAFAPRGPYATAPAAPYPPASPPRPPKPPKERSPLGAATFSLIFVAIGVVTVLDLTNAVPVTTSGYFAAALVTIGLGLLVGAWFGRARWLIALGLAATAALGISTLAESSVDDNNGRVDWRPVSYDQLAETYENSFGDSNLDLRQVDFTGRDATVAVRVQVGALRVIVPPNVDVTTSVDLGAGDARVFDSGWSGIHGGSRETTDLGPDGPGGGKLQLNLRVGTGHVEVSR
ncbi:PspC domain-containing protein [Plantactinospora siamensis]|uniref:PspC domain-containing protein n=1 Tax=Plantactinospora siamensis TaxID=555372 RepID=A0ABV6NPM0_9ACTN